MLNLKHVVNVLVDAFVFILRFICGVFLFVSLVVCFTSPEDFHGGDWIFGLLSGVASCGLAADCVDYFKQKKYLSKGEKLPAEPRPPMHNGGK